MILQGGSVMEKLQRRFGFGIWLRDAVAEEGRTRGSLARGLCEVADWRNAKGEFCLASTRRALPALAADLGMRSSVPIILQFRSGMSRVGFRFDAPRAKPEA